MTQTTDAALSTGTPADVISRKRIVMVVGSGGVGKTTTSATLGLLAALRGRRVLVLTIDPARRLADALSVSALSHEIKKSPKNGCASWRRHAAKPRFQVACSTR